MIALGIMSIGLQVSRYAIDKKFNTRTDTILFVLELLTIVALIICIFVLIFIYQGYVPWNSPGFLPFISKYGVIASNADPSKFAVVPAAMYPAVTYAAAIDAYRNSPNGLATGIFAWDGVAVTILRADAVHLADAAPSGTSWVFQDLNTVVGKTR